MKDAEEIDEMTYRVKGHYSAIRAYSITCRVSSNKPISNNIIFAEMF